jgi:glycosyltransferase involved in cell wall biosynthesis
VAVVSRYARADPRIRLVTTGGIGRGRALNRAIAEARADLIANLDADDLSHPERLRRQVEAMAREPQFAIIATEWVRIDGASSPLWAEVDRGACVRVEDVTRALAISNPICHSSAMIRKATVVEIGGYDEARRVLFDYDLWVRSAAAGLRLGRIQLPLTAKRIHPGQFYLHTARMRYLWASLRVQARAMRILGFRIWHPPVIVLRFLWLVLPLSARDAISKLGGALRIGQKRSA